MFLELYWAVKNGDKEKFSKLINTLSDLEKFYDGGFTLLQIAATNNFLKIVQILLNHGANVNSQNQNGTSALIMASKYGHKDVVEMLIQRGARVNLQDYNGTSALLWA